MPGIAYLISTFKEPERVVRLVKRLASPEDLFYVHFDKKIGSAKFMLWKKYIEKECDNLRIEVVSKTAVNWGSFGLTESTLEAMQYFSAYKYSFFVNLSGDCYPLKSKQFIKSELKNEYFGYMSHWKMPYQHWYKGGMNRINNNFIFIHHSKYPYVKILRFPRLRRKLPCGLEPYGGTNWFCLPKELVEYLIQFESQNPAIAKFFKTTFAPAEMFFTTIMLNSPYSKRIINDDKRIINWTDGNSIGNVGVFTSKHYDILLKSEKLFARKFDPKIDYKILDMIDKLL